MALHKKTADNLPMDIKDTALSAARRAGAILREGLGRSHTVEYKGAVDLVTEMDREAEDVIVSIIKEAFPSHDIVTEETAAELTGSDFKWIIDPLDGTTNYAHGFPIFCVSIALEEKGMIKLGAVYGPMLDEMFFAERGGGAYLNGKPIRVSDTATLDKSLLATGFPYDVRVSRQNNLDHFANFAVRAQAIRRAGAAALDLSYVGCGRFDGFWEMKLKPWDVAAAHLIVKEAGGTVTDFKGDEFSIYSSECLASNGSIHRPMLDVLAKKAR